MVDDLQIVGGHPALDLANTRAPRLPDGVEYLTSPATLLAWARRTRLVNDAEGDRIAEAWSTSPAAGATALADVLALRDLIDPVLAGESLPALTRRWVAALGRSALVPAANAPAAVLDIGVEPTQMIGDRLADAVVDLLRQADLTRLRACPAAEGGCGFLFLDRSRNGSRRWCSMGDCGTQAKSRRLTERRRASRVS